MSDDDESIFGDLEEMLGRIYPDGRFRSRYYDREGNPLRLSDYARLFNDEKYQRVAVDTLDEGNVWISTVWLGLDHNFMSQGPPMIFETMVFVHSTEEQIRKRAEWWTKRGLPAHDFPWEDLQCERYATEEAAREGHRRIVDSLRVRMDVVLTDADDEQV